jgi:hypothetical protein
MSEGNALHLSRNGLNDEDFRQILIGLSSYHRREQRPRKCELQRREKGRVAKILANLPTNVSALHVASNEGIGDAGMMHLHLIPDTVTFLNISHCGLTPIGIKRVCDFLKSNKSIAQLCMCDNRMGSEGFQEVADMMKVNNTVIELRIISCQTSSAADFCYLSEGLAQNTGLRGLSMGGNDRLTDDHVQNLCPGLALNKGLESLQLWPYLGRSITETGLGYLETVLRTNVYLKDVFIPNDDIPDGPGTIWSKMMHWLGLNQCNRKLLKDPNATPTQWRDAIIQSSEAWNPDAIFMFLTNKPEWCMM